MLAIFDSSPSHIAPSLVLITVFAVTEASDFQVAVLGQTFVFTCKANRSFTEVAWLYEDRDIGRYTDRNQRYDVNTDDRRLFSLFRVEDVKFYDAGDYSCIQYFRDKRVEKRMYTLQVTGVPRITSSKNEYTENDTILALCCIGIGLAGGRISLLWFIGTESLTPSNRTQMVDRINAYEVEVCSTIYFQSSRYFHDLPLVCLLPHPYNISTSRKMEVFYSPRVRMLMTSHVIPVSKENDVKVMCLGEGNPQPIVKMQKKIDDIWWLSSIKPTFISRRGGNTTWLFRVNNTSSDMTGTYRCAAGNSLGEGYSTETIEIVDIHRQGPVAIYVLLPIAVIALLIFFVAKTDKCISILANIRQSLHTVVDAISENSRSGDNNKCNDKHEEYDQTIPQTNSMPESNNIVYITHSYEGSIDTARDSKHTPGTEYLKSNSEYGTEHVNVHHNHTYESILSQRKFSRSLEVPRERGNSENGPHYHTLERETDIKSTYYEEANRYCDAESKK
ncbi:Cell adhesion molecule 1 [Holothuria leucospilota]|uniref:Cell adhesion molecule 1 n=1 Tax=Holothuria leucospilota TaxID=206669 RepID=A0A9Q1BYR3_HOLLE|nr:Cell adhesion molecule 1 [Holothuria leucospilota]